MSTPTTVAAAVSGGPNRADVEMVLAFARRMGVSVGDLAASAAQVPVPTFAEYVPRVIERMPAPSCRIYRPYWSRIVVQWEQRRLDAAWLPRRGNVRLALKRIRRNHDSMAGWSASAHSNPAAANTATTASLKRRRSRFRMTARWLR